MSTRIPSSGLKAVLTGAVFVLWVTTANAGCIFDGPDPLDPTLPQNSTSFCGRNPALADCPIFWETMKRVSYCRRIACQRQGEQQQSDAYYDCTMGASPSYRSGLPPPSGR
jgi:hypothetical protein